MFKGMYKILTPCQTYSTYNLMYNSMYQIYKLGLARGVSTSASTTLAGLDVKSAQIHTLQRSIATL